MYTSVALFISLMKPRFFITFLLPFASMIRLEAIRLEKMENMNKPKNPKFPEEFFGFQKNERVSKNNCRSNQLLFIEAEVLLWVISNITLLYLLSKAIAQEKRGYCGTKSNLALRIRPHAPALLQMKRVFNEKATSYISTSPQLGSRNHMTSDSFVMRMKWSTFQHCLHNHLVSLCV